MTTICYNNQGEGNMSMPDLDLLSEEHKEALAEDCEDYLLHRSIPLISHSYDTIIRQAFKEGYRLEKFDRPILFN